jgi:hypothetical protein
MSEENTKIKESDLESFVNDIVEQEIKRRKELIDKRMELEAKRFEFKNLYTPEITELILKHLDILLETTKNFLLVFSTIITASFVVNETQFPTIVLIRCISIIFLLVSIMITVFVLWKRGNEKNKIVNNINSYKEVYNKFHDVLVDSIEFPKDENLREILRKEAKRKVKESNFIKPYLPDSWKS